MPTLALGDVTSSTEGEKANLLNAYFHSCFNKAHAPLSPSVGLPPALSSNLLCTEEVYDHLVSLDVSKSSGPDGISARMLKYTATSIVPSATKLFNQSIIQAQIPVQWKRSVIVPILKSSDASSPTNYRPISLLPLLNKLLEWHIYEIILHHLLLNGILTPTQWGFLEGTSTVTALIKCTDDRLRCLEDGNDICAVFFDYRKALDSVPHRPLVVKLRSYGLDNCIINWIKHYLAERTRVVAVDRSEYNPLPVLSGVPQGSVLGPLLYINDLPDAVQDTLSHLNLFADDVLLYQTVVCAADFLLLQQVIGCIELWSTDNYLDFNISMCKYIIVLHKRNPPEPVAPLTLFSSVLNQVDNYKYLGVLLTDNLSWSMQVESVCQKDRRVLGLLYRRFYGQASQETLKQLYLSLVRPHLDYASQVWDLYLLKDKTALEKIQKYACKSATSNWESGYEELLSLMELQSLQDRRTDSKLGLLFKLVHNLCYFPVDSWGFQTTPRCSRNSNSLQLLRPLTHTNAHLNSFFPHTIAK